MKPDTSGTIFLPPQSSTISPQVDSLFNFVFWTSVIFFLIVTLGVTYFVIRYRRRAATTLATNPAHNTKLEILWTVIPAILVFIVFFWGFRVFLRMQIVPKDAIQVKVTGQKWFWTFDYPKEQVNSLNELVVPIDTPVELTMSSTDVIHSFYVPGFRIKMDVLPNRYTITWFEATQEGVYDLFCAEYCGTGHSQMIGKVRVVNEREYREWLQSSSAPAEGVSLVEYGAKLYTSKACVTCHSIDGRPGIGPTLKGIFGKSHLMQSNEQIVVDPNYIRESILNPSAKIVRGYQAVMPSYQGIITDREIDGLVEYIKSLSEN